MYLHPDSRDAGRPRDDKKPDGDDEGMSLAALEALGDAFGEFSEECDPQGPVDQCTEATGVWSSRSCCARMSIKMGDNEKPEEMY